MTTRREWLKAGMLGAGVLALGSASRRIGAAGSPSRAALIQRAIPSSGERLPIIGLGSSATFSQAARDEDIQALKAVMAAMVEGGGRVFDTAPSYGASEAVAGTIAGQLGITSTLFWATKLNVAGFGGGKADRQAALAQLERSFARAGKPVIDLVQIHNMGDIATQLPLLKEYKQQGRIRYLGVTTTFPSQYEALVELMKREPLDFIGTNYAIDDRFAEETILPLARDRGIGVLVYAPFGRTRLWRRVRDQSLPGWAADFGAQTWAQFFLKYVAGHADVTAITPATSKAQNMLDNLRGGMGLLPDAGQRRRMAELVDSLPMA